MPATRQALTIDPQGVTVVVDILDASSTSVTCYTASGGDTSHTLPKTISSATDFHLTAVGTYTVSAKINGNEVANDDLVLDGVPRIYTVNPLGSAAKLVAAFASAGVNDQTDDYTLALTDAEGTVTMTKGSANALTIPPNSSVAFPIGTRVTAVQLGAGATTVTAGAGVTLRYLATATLVMAQYSTVSLVKIATNTWAVSGDLVAA